MIITSARGRRPSVRQGATIFLSVSLLCHRCWLWWVLWWLWLRSGEVGWAWWGKGWCQQDGPLGLEAAWCCCLGGVVVVLVPVSAKEGEVGSKSLKPAGLLSQVLVPCVQLVLGSGHLAFVLGKASREWYWLSRYVDPAMALMFSPGRLISIDLFEDRGFNGACPKLEKLLVLCLLQGSIKL